MKKLLLLILLLFFVNPTFAIEWLNLTSNTGKSVGLDVDSIKEFNSYYFYNIKVHNDNNQEVVVTVQAKKTHPFCARIKHYTLNQYENLKGDYINITSNMTQRLEPVTYNSRVFVAYKKVVELMNKKNRPQITF